MTFLLRLRRESLILLALTATVIVGGYLFFRRAFNLAEPIPFVQEVILIVLGTIVTALITALLLNRQTVLELQKEQNLRYLELKTKTFEQLFDRLERFITKGKLERHDLIELWFITHKLAVVATPPVLEEYHRFLQTFNRAASDGIVSPQDGEAISEALAKLTVEIRRELVGELDSLFPYSPEQIRDLVLENEARATALRLDGSPKPRSTGTG